MTRWVPLELTVWHCNENIHGSQVLGINHDLADRESIYFYYRTFLNFEDTTLAMNYCCATNLHILMSLHFNTFARLLVGSANLAHSMQLRNVFADSVTHSSI